MKRPKLRLDLDALTVESFDTDARGARDGGTVFGHNGWTEPVDQIETAALTCIGCTHQTGCGRASCGCGTGGGSPSGDVTCGLTYCNDTCDLCHSFITDSPQRC